MASPSGRRKIQLTGQTKERRQRYLSDLFVEDRNLSPVIDYSDNGRLVGVIDRRTGDWAKVQGPPLPDSMQHELAVRQMHSIADQQPSPGVAYFIGGDDGPIKIGMSIQVETRLKAIQANSPVILRVLATNFGGAVRESAYHAQFFAHRLHGEWFARHPDILAEIERLSA